MAIYNAVIPVAGLGTRLLPATKSQPKEMLPVGRKPIVQYIVEELEHCGIKQLLFVTGRGKNSIEDHFDENQELIHRLREDGKEELLAELEFERKDINFLYTRQKRQLGLGDAILCAKKFAGNEPFLVALGDSIIGSNKLSSISKEISEIYELHNADAVIAVQEVAPNEISLYGIVGKKDAAEDIFEISQVIEKPNKEDAPSNLAIAARYVFSPRIFPMIEKTAGDRTGKEVQLTSAIQLLIEQGGRVIGVKIPSDEKRYDIGNFKSYFETFIEFALTDPEYGDELKKIISKFTK